MAYPTSVAKTSTPAATAGREKGTAGPHKESIYEQIAGFVGFFILLLICKTFFLQLYEIPTGSMADTLHGEFATVTCPNCGYEFAVGPDNDGPVPFTIARCVNCRTLMRNPEAPARSDFQQFPITTWDRHGGDRIIVHGWTYEFPFRWCESFAPRRWDVVVFKYPTEPQTNYIKRLIGLPSETVEIIDGDVFVNGKVARKPRYAQHTLWMPYNLHDYLAKGPSLFDPRYKPRWAAQTPESAWIDTATRVPRFDGVDRPRGEIRFVTSPDGDSQPGEIVDAYGYNTPGELAMRVRPDMAPQIVTDVRVSADVTIDAGDGYVELSVSKHGDRFFARLLANGQLTLEHAPLAGGERTIWSTTSIRAPIRHRKFSLGSADYRIVVEIDDDEVLTSTDQQFDASTETAQQLSKGKKSPLIAIIAERVRASFEHIQIDRDVYYTNARRTDRDGKPGNATAGNPLTLPGDACFVLGDNSPNSRDARFWNELDVGPHLKEAFKAGEYVPGTVPVRDLLGRAFFVYWPGSRGPGVKSYRILPDAGRVRWIH